MLTMIVHIQGLPAVFAKPSSRSACCCLVGEAKLRNLHVQHRTTNLEILQILLAATRFQCADVYTNGHLDSSYKLHQISLRLKLWLEQMMAELIGDILTEQTSCQNCVSEIQAEKLVHQRNG